MKFAQSSLIVATFCLLGFTNIAKDHRSFRIVQDPQRISTVVIGNSHSNSLLIPEWLNGFYLNEPGALLDEKLRQVEKAKGLFGNLNLIIMNLAPVDFVFCSSVDVVLDQDILVLGQSKATQMLENVRIVLDMLVMDPRRYTKPSIEEFNLGNGKRPAPVERIERNGAENHLRDCIDSESSDFSSKVEALQRIVDAINNEQMKLIILVPPHGSQYRAEMSDHDRGRIAIATMRSEMQNLESRNKSICTIDLYSFAVTAKMFWDGDHLNADGEEFIAPVLESKIQDCLTEMS